MDVHCGSSPNSPEGTMVLPRKGYHETRPVSYPTFRAAIFASTDFRISGSGWGSTRLGFIRSDLSLFGSLHDSQGVPSTAPVGKTVLHLKHS